MADLRQRRTLSFPRVLNWPSHLRARTEQLRTASLQAQLDEALAENKILRKKIDELENMPWLISVPSSSTVGASTSSSNEVVSEIAVRPLGESTAPSACVRPLGESTAPSAWLAARPLAPLPLEVPPVLVPYLVPPPSAPLLLAQPPHASPPSAPEVAAAAAEAEAAAAQKTAAEKAKAEKAAAEKAAAEKAAVEKAAAESATAADAAAADAESTAAAATDADVDTATDVVTLDAVTLDAVTLDVVTLDATFGALLMTAPSSSVPPVVPMVLMTAPSSSVPLVVPLAIRPLSARSDGRSDARSDGRSSSELTGDGTGDRLVMIGRLQSPTALFRPISPSSVPLSPLSPAVISSASILPAIIPSPPHTRPPPHPRSPPSKPPSPAKPEHPILAAARKSLRAARLESHAMTHARPILGSVPIPSTAAASAPSVEMNSETSPLANLKANLRPTASLARARGGAKSPIGSFAGQGSKQRHGPGVAVNMRPAVNGAEAVTSGAWPEWLTPLVHCLWNSAVVSASTRPPPTSVNHGVNGHLHASSGSRQQHARGGGVEETTTGGGKATNPSKHDQPNNMGEPSFETKTTPFRQGFVVLPNTAPHLFTTPPQDRRQGPPAGLLIGLPNGMPTGLPNGGLTPTEGHQSSPIKINNGLVPTVGVEQRTPPSMGRIVEAPISGGKDHPHWSLEL